MKPTQEPEEEDLALAIEAAAGSLVIGGSLIYGLIQGLLTLF